MRRKVARARRVVHAGRAGVLEPVEPVNLARTVGLEPGVELGTGVIGSRKPRLVARSPRIKPFAPGVERRIDAPRPGRFARRIRVGHRNVAVLALHFVEVVEVTKAVVVIRRVAREQRHVAAIPLPDDADTRHAGHLRLPAVQLLHVLLGELDRLVVKLHPVGMRVQKNVCIGSERRQDGGSHEQRGDFLHVAYLLRK